MNHLKLRVGVFCFSLILGIILFYSVINSLLSASLAYKQLYSHIPLIPLVSVFFLLADRQSIFRQMDWGWKSGILLIIIAIMVNLTGKDYRAELAEQNYLSLMMTGVFVWTVGCFFMAFGVAAAKRALFPLLFLVFVIPIPTPILNPVVKTLQIGSAHATHFLFKVIGIPFHREGFLFSIPGISVEVAEQCSGIRSSLCLAITSILAGYLFLKKGWSKVVLVLSVFPITVFKNALRIVTLSLLAAYVDPGFIGRSWLHTSGGIPFFVVGLMLLGPVLWGLRKAEKAGGQKSAQPLARQGGQFDRTGNIDREPI
jgi:exosortase